MPYVLLYHGNGGFSTIKPMQYSNETIKVTHPLLYHLDTPCEGMWKSSEGAYMASWKYSDDTDFIEFTIRTKQSQNRWTAIGFALQNNLVIMK